MPHPALRSSAMGGSLVVAGNPGAPVMAWDWLFNNTATRSGKVVTWRVPSSAGSYPARLTVTAAKFDRSQRRRP